MLLCNSGFVVILLIVARQQLLLSAPGETRGKHSPELFHGKEVYATCASTKSLSFSIPI